MLSSGRIRNAIALLAFLVSVSPSHASPATTCAGDCDLDRIVTVDEIVRLVTAALNGGIGGCAAGDVDQNQTVSVDEILKALTSALFGCVAPIPGPDLTRQFPGPRLALDHPPLALAVADIDGDQDADLATVSGAHDSLSILLQQPGGGFAAERQIAVGRGPVDLSAALLGAARTPAFVCANSQSDTVTVTSFANGNFVTASFAAGESPVALGVADLNRDSFADVVVANAESNNLSVLLGTADGGFTTAMHFDVNASPLSLAVGDVDRDLVPDVLVAFGSAQLSFLRNAGNGRLESPLPVDVGLATNGVELADLNGDLVNDVVAKVMSDGPGVVVAASALLGRGNGAFDVVGEVLGRKAPSTLKVSDVDDDGIPDVVIDDPQGVSVSFGVGDGTFLGERRLDAGTAVSAADVADVDGDGRRDIVYADIVDSEVSIFWGLGGRDVATVRSFQTGGRLSAELRLVDVDNDGLDDLATMNPGSDDVSILRNLGDGDFAEPIVVPLMSQLLAMTVGHFDHDEFPDLVVGYQNQQCPACVAALRGIGDGHFDAPMTSATMPRIVSMSAGRLDADMLDDLVILSSSGVSVLTGVGGLMFVPADSLELPTPREMVVADFNADGFDDVGTANAESVSVLLADGTGSLEPAPDLETPAIITPTYIDSADLDADGNLDLAVGGRGRLAVFFGLGGGRFSSGQTVATVIDAASFSLAEVNGDNRVDLLTLSDGLAIHAGVVEGTFARAQRFVIDGAASEALAADLNADSVVDLATVNAGLDGSVSVLLGRPR